LRALRKYEFRPDRFRGVQVPVVLQVGTESPRELYATDALAAILPNVRIQELPGQAHEGMTTAPDLYVAAVHDILQAA
jgi:pimeloyl-ACP methyl ester carboxylesterase